jgi:enoyl-CoA hydratase
MTSEVLADGALLLERTDGVVTLTFNRPERLNAMTGAMFDAFAVLVEEAATDSSLRAIVLRGAGGQAFSAGNEITAFAGMETGADVVEFDRGQRSVLRAFAELPQVTIAAIDGVCVGGGLGIATFCDIRVATPHSRFGYPIARTLGNALSAVVLGRCVAVFGEPLTREMLLASRMITADRACAVGALAAVVPAEELDGFIAGLTKGIRRSAPGTIATTKLQLLRLSDALLADDGDDALLVERYDSADFREGVRAFTAGEKPTFTGS